MTQKILTCALAVAVLLCVAGQVSAGGPMCAPPMCGPNYCMPPMCAPPMPVCRPVMCAPPRCGPPPCGPRMCKPNPLAQICKGAFALVTGVIALPFKVVGSVINSLCCPPRCCPPRCGPPRMACVPISVPRFILGPPPGMAYGPRHRPMGFGHGAPRRFSPMAKAKKSADITFMAVASDGFFGAYW